MNSQPIRAINSATTYALARRIERALRPIIESKNPTAEMHINLTLGAARYREPFHVTVCVFTVNPEFELVFQEICLDHTDVIPDLVSKLRRSLPTAVDFDA